MSSIFCTSWRNSATLRRVGDRPLRSFTAGLRRDLDAVVAGLTLKYNSGAVEGTVNRIKQLKAAMYGRANPTSLRKLILLA